MIHLKYTYLFVLITVAFIGCTEIYTPNIDSTSEALVVEGLITDGTGPFTIKLSIASAHQSDLTSDLININKEEAVWDAKLSIKDNENKNINLISMGYGNYITPPSFSAKTGNVYKLHIETKDGSIYESNPEQLLPAQSYDSIHAIYTTQSFLNYKNELVSVPGADIRFDLFKSLPTTNLVTSCRFTSNITLQYTYFVNANLFVLGWKSFLLDGNENITEEKSANTGGLILNHALCFMPYGVDYYNFTIPPNAYIMYYLRVNQYTMTDDSYRFYKAANDQLAATGKIFDPITSQLHGNMKCVNNPSKIVLGLFEVSSVLEHAFFVSSGNKEVDITKVLTTKVPSDYEFQYSPQTIAYPSWWFHN